MTVRSRLARTITATLSTSLLLGLAACGSDSVSQGERPNKPSSTIIDYGSKARGTAIDITTLPGYTAPTPLANNWFSRPMTDMAGNVEWQVMDASGKPVTYTPDYQLAFGDPASYTEVPGVLTFRGNHTRSQPAYGTAQITQKKLEVVWKVDIGETKAEGVRFPGAGWTGQPLIVRWPEATRLAMGLPDKFANDANFTEVIYPTFDGNIYRLDLATGEKTKDPIAATWGFKGTGSIDPRGYPILYAGQGLADANGNTGPIRHRWFDLIQNKEIGGLEGMDAAAPRKDWGAFDSSTLIDRFTDTLIEPGENGLIYKVKLNSAFDPTAKTVSLNPQVTKLQYKTPNSHKFGIESSAVAYKNLMYATDNDGNLVCWDINTLQVLWSRNIDDDTDATLVLEHTADGVFIYTGNELDHRDASQPTNLRKINALTGALVWQYDLKTYRDENVNGGLMATPLLGVGELSDMVIFNVAKSPERRSGTLVALDKKTGKPIWTRNMVNYSWSSPVSITSTDGKQYLVLADYKGIMRLLDPNTGEQLDEINIGGNTEATPAVFGDMIVVANYDKKIWGIKVK